MKREKERQLRIQRMIRIAVPVAVLALVIVVGGISLIVHAVSAGKNSEGQEDNNNLETVRTGEISGAGGAADISGADVSENSVSGSDILNAGSGKRALRHPTVSTKQYSARETSQTAAPPSSIVSSNVIFIDQDTGEILTQRAAHTVINPASMTKVLTLLVASEHITDLDDTFVMTREITDYSYSHGCSSVGFEVGEEITVRDLLYGTILPSGGDAAVGLAYYVAGSQEAFVDMMNEKLEILGLSDTAHFTNCVGLYDEDHHCTAYDMAMIMEAAMDDDLCREVLSAHFYTTSKTAEHPDGLTISNLFLRRIEDKETGGEVLCGKTGYVVQSKNCAVSFGIDASGKKYICVTTGAPGPWKCIEDHAALYMTYAKEN